MDKKKVIEMIGNVENYLLAYEKSGKNADIAMALQQLHEAEGELSKPDWISVEDDLPDIDEKVLVCNEEIPYMWWDSSISSDVADMWKDEHGFLKEDHITHWRKIDKLEV